MSEVLEAWQAEAARGVVEGVDGHVLDIDGREWDADAPCGGPEALDRIELFDRDGGRQVTVRVRIELIEGTLT